MKILHGNQSKPTQLFIDVKVAQSKSIFTSDLLPEYVR